MDDVGAHAQGLHAVQVVQVVFEVELVEPERGEEGGEVGRLGGRAQEGEGEVGSVVFRGGISPGFSQSISAFWLFV